MKPTILSALLLLFALSCTRLGDDNPPLPQVNGNEPDSGTSAHFNFGRLISIKDSMSVYDASTGRLLIKTPPYGILFGAAINNTTVSDSLAYQPSPGRLLAMNINTGKIHYLKHFSYLYGGVSTCFPVIDSPYLYQGAYNNLGHFKLFCIKKNTGETVWESQASISYDQTPYKPSLTQTANTILVDMIDGPACFDKATGNLIWRNNSNTEFVKLNVHPYVYDGKLFVTSSQYHAVYAFDATHGKFLWKTPLPTTSSVLSGPVYAWQNTLFALTQESTNSRNIVMHCIDINTGAVTRTRQYPLAQWYIQYYNEYFYTYENVNQTFFPQRISKRLLSDGSVVWSKDLEGGIYDGVIITPAFVYCTETDPVNTSSWQRMNILDHNNGKILKTFPLFTNLSFAPVVMDSTGKAWQPARWFVPS